MELNFTPPDSDAAVDWALAYAASGMSIFPCNAQKRPLTEHGLKDATTDEAQIRSWWARYPHGDIGWAVPAEIVVVDLDVGVGADGLKDFFECIGVNPDDVQTPQASTPRGGRHLVFDANRRAYKNGVKLNGAAIDLRTIGGYIVLPCANNGRAWTKPLATPLAEAPTWIHSPPGSPRSPPRRRGGAPIRRRDALCPSGAGKRMRGDQGRGMRRARDGAQQGVFQHRRPGRRRRD